METPEEFEHIPWAQLAADHSAGRNRLVYVAAAALVALAVGAVVARAVWSPDGADATDVEPVATVTAPLPVAESLVPGLAADAPTVPTALFSEADLMAAVPVDISDAVAARAEWFVTDYFTADLDPLGSVPVRTALPATAELPDLPHDGAAVGIGYVEWARAFRVELVAPELYRVSVAFRTVGAKGEEPFLRMPVRAVDVVVSVPSDGRAMGMVDLPSPARVPGDIGAPPWPDAVGDVPQPIAEAALALADGWGREPAVAGGSTSGDGWRVVVTVGDEVGNRWPLSLWLDEGGQLTLPPWGEGE